MEEIKYPEEVKQEAWKRAVRRMENQPEETELKQSVMSGRQDTRVSDIY